MEALLRGEEENTERFNLDPRRREQRGQGRTGENGEVEARGGACEDWVPGQSSGGTVGGEQKPRLQLNTQWRRLEAGLTVMSLGVGEASEKREKSCHTWMR